MSKIILLDLKKDNWIQWLRYVNDVDLDNHCMKSLIRESSVGVIVSIM